VSAKERRPESSARGQCVCCGFRPWIRWKLDVVTVGTSPWRSVFICHAGKACRRRSDAARLAERRAMGLRR
jgi:hypothetical protein